MRLLSPCASFTLLHTAPSRTLRTRMLPMYTGNLFAVLSYRFEPVDINRLVLDNVKNDIIVAHSTKESLLIT